MLPYDILHIILSKPEIPCDTKVQFMCTNKKTLGNLCSPVKIPEGLEDALKYKLRQPTLKHQNYSLLVNPTRSPNMTFFIRNVKVAEKNETRITYSIYNLDTREVNIYNYFVV